MSWVWNGCIGGWGVSLVEDGQEMKTRMGERFEWGGG